MSEETSGIVTPKVIGKDSSNASSTSGGMLERIFDFISLGAVITSAGFALVVAGRSIFLGPSDSTMAKVSNPLNQEIKLIKERLLAMENLVVQASSQAFSEAAAAREIADQGSRIASIERTLDLKPREMIEVALLHERLSDIERDVEGTFSQTIREVDRAFNLMLATIAALVVSVISMSAGSYLRRGK